MRKLLDYVDKFDENVERLLRPLAQAVRALPQPLGYRLFVPRSVHD